jgi:hypothetical protein
MRESLLTWYDGSRWPGWDTGSLGALAWKVDPSPGSGAHFENVETNLDAADTSVRDTSYSWRSAVTGSSAIARRAGK